jgi:hypothetical protein
MTAPICEVIITADSEEWLINFTGSLAGGMWPADLSDQIYLSLGRQHPR